MDNKKPKKYIPICTREQVGELWSPIAKDPANTIGLYARSEKKQIQYKMIDMGAFCVINSIDAQMLELLVKFGNEFKNRFHDMTKEDIEEFKQYKNFKLFNQGKN